MRHRAVAAKQAAAGGGGGVSIVQTGSASSVSSDPATVSLGAAPTEGNLLVALVTTRGLTVSFGSPWTTVDTETFSATNVGIAYRIAGASESSSVSVDYASSTGNDVDVFVVEATGVSALDLHAAATSSSGVATATNSGSTPARFVAVGCSKVTNVTGTTSRTPTGDWTGTFAGNGQIVGTAWFAAYVGLSDETASGGGQFLEYNRAVTMIATFT